MCQVQGKIGCTAQEEQHSESQPHMEQPHSGEHYRGDPWDLHVFNDPQQSVSKETFCYENQTKEAGILSSALPEH